MNQSDGIRETGNESQARVGRVWAMAKDVYKQDELARTFLSWPHQLLDGRTPLDVAREAEHGADAVVAILGRLKYGSVG